MSDETWTLMAYLAGDNNLTDNCVYSMAEMKEAEFDDRITIFAQFDPQDEFLSTHRYRIRKRGGRPNARITTRDLVSPHINDDIIDTANGNGFTKESRVVVRRKEGVSDLQPGETDTGSPETLQNFITFCIENRPEDRFLLILSGHGAGTERDYLLRDDTPGGYLTIPEFRRVFEFIEGTKHKIAPKTKKDYKDEPTIDILGMDTCLMSMAEICYELRGMVNILVSSESYSPASGWPYRQIVTRLQQDTLKGAGPEDIASAIVEEYVKGYIDYSLGGLSVDIAALRVNQIDGLAARVKSLAAAMKRELKNSEAFKDAIILAHWEAQSYNGELFVDLSDFCDCLKRRYKEEVIVKRCEAVMDFIRDKLVIKSCVSGPAYQFSNGASIYFPWASVAPDYRKLSFAQKSGWADFLEDYVTLTRRKPRGCEDDDKLLYGQELDESETNRLLSLNTAPSRPLRMSSGRMSSGRMSSGRGMGNPIRSMRNPPIVDVPNNCIKDVVNDFEGASKLIFKQIKK